MEKKKVIDMVENNKIARTFLNSLKLDNNKIIKSGSLFKEYLTEISGSELSDNYILKSILKTGFKENEFDQISRCHLKAAANSLDRFLSGISNDTLKLKKIAPILEDLICDLKEFIIRIDSKHDYSFLIGNTNSSSSLFYFDAAKYMFYNKALPENLTYDVTQNLSVLAIRQSIELRVKRVLGIDSLRTNSNQNIELSKLLKILNNLKNIKLDPIFKSEILNEINKWSNHYIHRGLRPFPWVTENVFEYISPIFQPGKHEKGFGWYKSSIVNSQNEYRDTLKKTIEDEFGEDVKIIWSDRFENIVLNKDTSYNKDFHQ